MSRVYRCAISLQIWRDQLGRDLIEYAMIAGFLAASSSLVIPDFVKNVSMLIGKISTAWAGRG